MSADSLRSVRQSVTVFLLFALIGYTVLPARTNASGSVAKTNGPAADTGQPARPQKENKYARKDNCPSCSPPGDQELYIPLTDLPEAKGGELVFNSRSPKAMAVTPTFYKLDGTAVVGAPVTIQSAEIRYADFKKLLPAEHRGEKDWGGLSLAYYGVAREMWAQFRFLGVNGGGNVDEFFIVSSEQRSDVQEAAWWMPKKSAAVIALGNVTDLPTGATVNFGDGETQTVNLAPHGTTLVRRAHDGNAGAESVRIDITGVPGSIIPTGVITSKEGSFDSVIRFYDTKNAKQQNLFANGFRLGGVTPHMVLKNTGTLPVIAQPEFITLGGTASAPPVSLPDVNLAAGETKEVDLTPLLQSRGSRPDLDVVSVQVTNSGAPGTLIGSFHGINNKTGMSYDTPLRDSGPARTMTGSYPWKVSKDYTTVVYITNITDEPAQFVGVINYDGGDYLLDARELAPRETAVLDLREIREKQEVNKEHQKMAKDKSLGQFKWAVRGDTKGKIALIGRAEMVSLSQNISTSYSCNDPCPPSYEGSIDPFFPPIVFVSDTGGSAAWETVYYSWGYSYGPYSVGASWTLDSQVGSLSPSDGPSTTMTGTTAGDATLDGFIGWQNTYSYDGRDCYVNAPVPEGGQTPVQVDRLRIRVPNPPVPDDTQESVSAGIIAGESFTIIVDALNGNGNVDVANDQTVTVTNSRTLDSSETGVPSSFQLSGGMYTKLVTLNRVNGTDTGTTFRFKPSGGGQIDFGLYTYFSVIASREGLVGGTTSCGHTITSNDRFVALPAGGLCNKGVVLRKGGAGTGVFTNVRDIGPWFPHPTATSGNPCQGGDDPYWNTGGVPRTETTSCDSNDAGIDLADGTFSDLGLTGNTRILWRFN
jgi:hypothetical protein